jgi:hypothetical protein
MRVRYSLSEGAPQGQHHTDGRVIFAEVSSRLLGSTRKYLLTSQRSALILFAFTSPPLIAVFSESSFLKVASFYYCD